MSQALDQVPDGSISLSMISALFMEFEHKQKVRDI